MNISCWYFCDNTLTNIVATDKIQLEYPKLIGVCCVAHLSGILIKDIFKLDQAKSIIKKIRYMVDVVGSMLKHFSYTCFSYG